MKTTSDYGAKLIDHMGSDLTVVNAARVSFDKESELEVVDWKPTEDRSFDPVYKLADKDAKLIRYLATHGHWSPFAHPQLSFRIKAPLFVAAQLKKHQIGLTWNEVSRRYVDSEPEFYFPKEWRGRASNVKQGSSQNIISGDFINPDYYDAVEQALYVYEMFLEHNICPEQARMVLPQSTMTEWVWTGSLMAFARVCKQRLDPHAQLETRWVAEDIAQALAQHFPVSWQALMKDLN